ncbi:RNA cytosine-C(5)-methyltransferase NSUN2 [Hydra vulgaris]|uniref:tRNA (cytosine(34)-C(5))-methyltransferase n=1 Tax=Hydra vulgaris TaxID=6087 RepID=A0ABM4C1P5_HYDVU
MGKRKNKKHEEKRKDLAWKDIVKENMLMENYYKAQCIVDENEWGHFIEVCRKDLPSTFRITKIRGHAIDLLKSLKDGYINKITSSDVNDAIPSEKTEEEPENEQDLLLEPIAWYPDELAWTSNLSRRFIRRSDILHKLHNFLVEDSECGAITRQEAVSMIPPMLLDVKPHHLVLDMCAAPGSKTAQIIELMHENQHEALPTGALIANDADHKRCYMLTHQAKRLNTPCVIITNHDASIFPKLILKNESGENEALSFDRVLCDVPCSGDGTLRKNPLIWSKWTPHMGIALHQLQIRILIRGLEMLKIGGRLVYSTCSFNPVENEAVLSHVLLQSKNTVQLVDCSKELPDLKRKPGLLNWKVFNKQGMELKFFEETGKPSLIKPSMFPPSIEEAKSINLQFCLRIYPHLQDTGGFFVAVLEKKAELPWSKVMHATNESISLKNFNDVQNSKSFDSETPVDSMIEKINNQAVADLDVNAKTSDEVSSEPVKKKFKRGSIKEDPYIFLSEDDPDINAIRVFYNLSDNLPSKQLLVRSLGTGKKRHIYLVSKAVHNIMTHNKNIRIINTGVRIVTRSALKAGTNDHGVEYRLVQEGINLIIKYISSRIITISYNDMLMLLSNFDLPFEKLSQEAQTALTSVEMGCIIWLFKAEANYTISSDLWFCGHQGKKVVQCMLSKEERKHFLRLLAAPIPEDFHLQFKRIATQNKDDLKEE